MFMQYLDGCSEPYCFYELLTLMFAMSYFLSNYCCTYLQHGVNMFLQNFNTEVISYLV